MRIQSKSQGQKYGDTNLAHMLAITRVTEFWNKFRSRKCEDWIIDNTWVEQYDKRFIRENPDRTKDHFFHIPDLAFIDWQFRPILKLVIEIDGESHDAATRQISDGIFETWIGTHYKGYVQVIRLQKAELTGPLELAEEYLKKELRAFLE